MKLIYRGTTYDYAPAKTLSHPFQPVRRSGPAYTLIYRGHNYQVDPNIKPAEVAALPTTYQLIYRGSPYVVNRTAQRKVTLVGLELEPFFREPIESN